MTICQTPDCPRLAQTPRGNLDFCNHCASEYDFEAADKAPAEPDEYDREEMRR